MNEAQEVEHKAQALPPEIEETGKGKIKSLFRKLESSLIGEIKQRLEGINAGLAEVERTLDKKYGGLYKTLIHTFLTKQEEKIYNTELSVQATREVLADYIYSETKSTQTKEEFLVEFNATFEEKLQSVDKRIKAQEAEKHDKTTGQDSDK